jgi:CHAT domain-containing protein/tetratricopeptide repeat protein
MRTITLELLRHGPAHNQLLSPLTPYLALCENHAAVTLHVPFEHNQFLHRLSALGYKLKDESRVFQLKDTARVLGEMLAEIPGLTAESNKDDQDADPLTHLRLIISASELALLPFELALSPNGLPGAGQHLLLQPQMPICLTREIRRVPGEKFQWPTKPKILLIAAAPEELGAQIPLESHLLVLRRLISPWVKYYPNDEKRRLRVAEHLHVLPGASIEAIEEACASGSYSHIHILAHGVEVSDGYDRRFALALHDARFPEKIDYISGPRLATALRPSHRPGSQGVFRPAVVTLASCDSGNVGSVAGAGASIAHALHEAGIPMVVAGQFPLSFEGSVRLLECLYEGLLWGVDPRHLLYDLRRRLYTQFQQNHDWASLTAYISFPSDFDEQLQGMKIQQANRSVNAAMNHADEATRKLSKRIQTHSSSEGQETSPRDKKALIRNAIEKIEKAKGRLEGLLKRFPHQDSEVHGLLASAEKREAEMMWWAFRIPDLFNPKESKDFEIKHRRLLRKSRDHYWESFMLKRSDAWGLVQYLSLAVIIELSSLVADNPLEPDDAKPLEPAETPEPNDCDDDKQNPEELWSMAHLLSLYDLSSCVEKKRIWALGNLIELYLVALIMNNNESGRWESFKKHALRYADMLVELAGRDSFSVYSTRRQILRYIEWFGDIANLDEPVIEMATSLADRFTEEAEERWK